LDAYSTSFTSTTGRETVSSADNNNNNNNNGNAEKRKVFFSITRNETKVNVLTSSSCHKFIKQKNNMD
jgi:hypothetical protein